VRGSQPASLPASLVTHAQNTRGTDRHRVRTKELGG